LANSPSNLASKDQFGVKKTWAPAVVSAESLAIGAPVTVKLEPGKA
jgi:hypothetical protein